MFYFLSASAASATATPPSSQEQLMSTVLMFGAVFIIFYFLIIRPQQKKFKQHQAMVSAIKSGDKVITSGGILGKVTKPENKDGIIEVEIAKGIEIKVLANTVATVVNSKAASANDN